MKDGKLDIAIVGAGPAGLACAIEVKKRGYSISSFFSKIFLTDDR